MGGELRTLCPVAAHIERWVGPTSWVFGDRLAGTPYIDVHLVEASGERAFEMLVTCGMSFRPMTAPDAGEGPFAELVALLPAGWPLTPAALHDERNRWPLDLLRDLARYPHEHATWLGHGHTVRSPGRTPEPCGPGTELSVSLLLPPRSLPREFHTLDQDGKHIHFWAVVPIYHQELELMLDLGLDALLDRFDQLGVDDVIEPRRRNAALST